MEPLKLIAPGTGVVLGLLWVQPEVVERLKAGGSLNFIKRSNTRFRSFAEYRADLPGICSISPAYGWLDGAACYLHGITPNEIDVETQFAFTPGVGYFAMEGR